MKDFNVSEELKKKIVEDICQIDKIKQYEFDVNKLINYS